MRTLTSTLEAAQKAKRRLNPLVKIVLSRSGQATKTYLKDRILSFTRTQSQWSHVVELTLHNADGAITALDFKGYKAILSRGLLGGAGEEFSSLDPLWCFAQRYDSGRTEWTGLIPTTLRLIGVFDRMALDNADEEYTPDNTDVKTIKTLLIEVANANIAPFAHCQSFTITFDATEETLLDSFNPADSFHISLGESRLAVFRKLLAYVKSVARVEDDEAIHVLNPTVSGSTFDYEYKLDVTDEHTYFTEGFRRRLVAPNVITVTSHPDTGTAVAGSADYSGSSTASDNALISIADFDRVRVSSDQEAQDVADARIQKLEQAADKGYLTSTINVGQEMFDYIKITDKRLNLNRVGNVGQIIERYKPGAPNPWQMTLNLGTVPDVLFPFIPGAFLPAQVSPEIFKQHVDDFIVFAEAVVAVLEDHERRITALEQGGKASKMFFNGAVDATPSQAAWIKEVGLPFTRTDNTLFFSPIIEEAPNVETFYVIDRGKNFWKYNLDARQWFELTPPNLVGTDPTLRTLAINPLGTKLACVSYDGTAPRILSLYDIGTDTWTDSAAAPDILGQSADLRSLVWEDDDTIWAWARKATSLNQGKCIKYVISTTTWSQFAADTGVQDFWQGRSAAIKGTTVVFGATIGAGGAGTDAPYAKYTIAGDSYAFVAKQSRANAFGYDKDKLWYTESGGTPTKRFGYLDTADESYHDDHFAQNNDIDDVFSQFGVSDDLNNIINFISTTAPELMSVREGGQYLVGTITAINLQEVLVEKPADGYTVTFIKRDSNLSWAVIDTQVLKLSDGAWDVYYPVGGDITSIKIRLL